MRIVFKSKKKIKSCSAELLQKKMETGSSAELLPRTEGGQITLRSVELVGPSELGVDGGRILHSQASQQLEPAPIKVKVKG